MVYFSPLRRINFSAEVAVLGEVGKVVRLSKQRIRRFYFWGRHHIIIIIIRAAIGWSYM